MKKFKTLFFSVFAVLLLAVVGVTGVYAATHLSVVTDGKVTYISDSLGIKLLMTQEYNDNGSSTVSYVTFGGFGSGSEHSTASDICTLVDSYSNSSVTANISVPNVSDSSDTLELLLFVKNYGDREYVPTVTITNSSKLTVTTDSYLFNPSSGHIDPIGTTKPASVSASAFSSSVKSEISANRYSSWTNSSTLEIGKIYAIKILIEFNENGIANVSDGNSGYNFDSNNFTMTITFEDPSAN